MCQFLFLMLPLTKQHIVPCLQTGDYSRRGQQGASNHWATKVAGARQRVKGEYWMHPQDLNRPGNDLLCAEWVAHCMRELTPKCAFTHTIHQRWLVFREREREIKFIGLFEDRGHRGPYSPYKPFNHNLYIGIIILPHIDNPQSTGYN